MEPTKNPNNTNGQIGGNGIGTNSDPIFHGMPKPGQPLASTPKFTDPAPSVPYMSQTHTSTTFAIDKASSSSVSVPNAAASSSVPPSPFATHSSSALDRLMNPDIGSAPMPASKPATPFGPASSMMPKPAVSASPAMMQAPASSIASSNAPLNVSSGNSSFKPYIPPASVASSPSSSQATHVSPASVPSSAASASPTSGYSVQRTPMQASSLSSLSPMTSMSSKSPASSMSPMASTPMQPTPFQGTQTINANQTKKSANTLILGFVALVVIFLLAGGGYYWYMMMSSPAANAPQGSTQTNNAQNANQPASSFPSIVTKPSTNTAAPTTGTAKPTTTAAKPAKPTRVTTPFTEEQRSIISSYIGAHINEFAVPRSSRSYEVTDVTFDGPDRALVQYTNGTASYTAIAVASVDSSNNVRIVSFNLLEK